MGTGNDMFRHFALWTSASGLPHIARAHNKCLCVFWILVFLVCAAMFAFQMVLLIQNYLSYNVIVNTQLKFQELDFPEVTVCNLNPYKRSLASSTVPQIQSLMDTYQWAIGNQSFGGDLWGLTNTTNDTMAIQANARTQLMYIAATLDNTTIKNIGYTLDEFILSCTFDGNPCNKKLTENDASGDFTRYLDATYGVCYQFNNKDPTKVYGSSRAGPTYGLKLLLQTDLDEYLNITESAGVRVTVTGQNEQVFPDAFGYNAAAGFTTSFSLKYVSTQRLGGQYGNCTAKKSTEYSVEGCFRTCLQNYIVGKCKCGDPRFAITAGQTYCSGSQITCVNNAAGVGTSGSSSSGFNAQSCNCPQLCSEATYTMTVSSAVWPAQRHIPDGCRPYSNNPKFTQDSQGVQDCLAWYGDNTMMVEIYYERMNFEALTENAAYPFVSLLSDFGGQIGLWIGVSVITMVEFLFIPIIVCIGYCCRKKDKPSIVDVDHEHDDLLDEEDDDNMFNKVGSKPGPPPPYPGISENQVGPAPPLTEKPPIDLYDNVDDVCVSPPVPQSAP